MSELLCPFCGKQPQGPMKDERGFHITCYDSYVYSSRHQMHVCEATEADAIAAWNTRATGWREIDEDTPQNKPLLVITERNGLKNQAIRAIHIPKLTVEVSPEDDSEYYEYSEEHDCYYMTENWYECVSYWDDFQFLLLQDAVTYWMPLPSAPEATP